MDKVRIENIDGKDGFYITENLVSTLPATATNYGVFFTATHPCTVMMVAEAHTVAGSDAGAVTLNIEKLISGQALDAGAEILTTSFSLKSTANTPVIKQGYNEINATNSVLKQGDRLALKDAGVLTAVAGLQVTVYFKRNGKGDYR